MKYIWRFVFINVKFLLLAISFIFLVLVDTLRILWDFNTSYCFTNQVVEEIKELDYFEKEEIGFGWEFDKKGYPSRLCTVYKIYPTYWNYILDSDYKIIKE